MHHCIRVLGTLFAAWILVARSASGATAVTVSGNQLVDEKGAPFQLHGVNRMSTEYACIYGYAFFDGPASPAENTAMLNGMLTWNINAVRIPVNEDCWNGTKPGLNPAWTGANYRNAMVQYVNQITASGMVAIVDLHWTSPNGRLATGQQPMADQDQSPAFWSSAAATFKSNPLVVFDLFNEPYIDRDPAVASLSAAWSCWLNGCTLYVHDDAQNPTGTTYSASGMQTLLNAVRSAGANNPVLLGGLSYSEEFSQYLAKLPTDPAHQLVVSFHAYPGNTCGMDNNPCRATITGLMAQMPLVVGEFGRDDCATVGIDEFLTFMDNNSGNYIGWSYNVTGNACGNGKYDLVSDYSGVPTTTGAAVKAHYLLRAVIVAGGPSCTVQMNKAGYVNGDTVQMQAFRITNPAASVLPTELKLWLALPGTDPLSILNVGATGSVQLPAQFNQDFGPITLFPVSAQLPRGSYAMGCRMLVPVTGKEIAATLATFTVQ
jgi:endoglucanase